ncbi:cell wall-binding protein [Bacillus toyonensis]|uniref:cell wall-binding protein n=1 Tax=Bacillus toyonensis TaxID=155322 RepID=UPI003D1D897E
MKKKFKTTGIGKKVIPATAALGILFSMAPIAENKASAGIGGALADISITVLGTVAKTYETFGLAPGELPPGTSIDEYAENLTYKAPNFTSGEFSITMYHTENDSKFTKSVKVFDPNGKSEIYKLKSGQQLKITEAGTIIDLNPNAKSVSEHNLLYITQAQLDEGKTGVVMNEAETAFVEKASGQNPRLVYAFYKKQFGKNSLDGFKGLGVDQFSHLTEEHKKLATLTSKPVSKDVLWNYLTNDAKALADFNNRVVNIFADTNLMLETKISLGHTSLQGADTTFQIIPIKKGSNKVVVKKGSKYLSGKEGNKLQYSDSMGDDEVLELVQIENSAADLLKFNLINKNGTRLADTKDGKGFTTNNVLSSDIRFQEKSNNRIHTWLREWYPGKENGKQKYDGIQIVADENDSTKRSAKDSSGNVIKNSWVNVSDVYYYAGSDGFLLKGWKEIEGKTYYFKDDYSMFKGGQGNIPIDDKYYHFDEEGALQRSAWKDNGSGFYTYSDASGVFIKDGLREIEGKIYYFQSGGSKKEELRLKDQNITLHFSGDKGALEKVSKMNGEALSDAGTYVTLDEKKLAFEKDGSIRKSGVSKIILPDLFNNTRERPLLVYYSLEDGPFYTGWKEIDGKKYYFRNGKNWTFDGHASIDGKRYYFNQEGQALLTGFVDINGKTFYMNDKGEKVSGLQTIDGKLYYFNTADSSMAKNGLFSISKTVSYAAGPDGVIYKNFKGYINNHSFGQRYIETNNEGIVTKK